MFQRENNMESHDVKKEPPDKSHGTETSEKPIAIVPRYLVKDKAPTEAKKEPEDEAPREYLKNVKKVDVGDQVKIDTVKVENVQGSEITDYSTWTQDNYLDYYGYADEDKVELFPFEPGEDDAEKFSDLFDMTKPVVKEEADATCPDEVFHKFPNQKKSQELAEDANTIKKKTPHDLVFHKAPDEIVLIKTEEANDVGHFDPLKEADANDQFKGTEEKDSHLIEAPRPYDPGITKNMKHEANESKVDDVKPDADEENETLYEPNYLEDQYEVKTCSEILVFDPQTQKFQPEGASVVVSLQNYSVSVTSYLKAERPFCQTSQCGTVVTCVQWFKLNDVNMMLNSSIITDPPEVSEVDEEAIEVDKEAIGEEESRRKNLALKVTEMMGKFLKYSL